MLTQDHLDTIASFPLFAPVPRAELEWMCARADVVRLAPDTILRDTGAVIDDMWIVLAGRLAVQVERSGARRNFHESGPGAVIGAMPFSRMRKAPARLAVEEDTTLCALSRSHFPDLMRECPELTSALVHQLLDRSRDFRTAEMHDDGWHVRPTKSQESHILTSMLGVDALALVPEDRDGIEAGEPVEIEFVQ